MMNDDRDDEDDESLISQCYIVLFLFLALVTNKTRETKKNDEKTKT